MVEPPIIPSFQLPIPPEIPTPALELPKLEVPYYKPILLPQKVKPGSLDQLRQKKEPSQESSKPSRQVEEQKKPFEKILESAAPYLQRDPRLDTLNGWPFNHQVQPSLPEPKVEEQIVEEKPEEEPQEEIEGVVVVDILGLGVPMPEPEILVAAGATATTSVAATLATTSMIKKLSGIMKPIIKKAISRIGNSDQEVEHLSWARQRLVQRPHRLLNKDFLDET
ncbi:MAG: hypothetical protein ACO24D_14825 [bacterium]